MRFVVVLSLIVASLISCAGEIAPPGEGEGEGEGEAGGVVRLEVSPESLDLVVGEDALLVVVGKEADGDTVDVSNRLQFSSENEAVATVDDAGNVSALSPGEGRLTAVFDRFTIGVAVRVTAPNPPTQLDYDDVRGLAGGPVLEVPQTDVRGGTFTIAPALPAGLVIAAATGTISGRVDVVVAPATFVVTAVNEAGSITASLSIEIVCDPAQAIPPRDVDVPDRGFVDDNDDGIDGMRCGPVFLSPSGLDSNAGTQEAPLLTLGRALLVAGQTAGRDIYVAAGTYAGPVSLQNNVSIYGGYDPITWARNADNDVVIDGGNPVITAFDLDGTLELQQLQLAGDNAFGASGDAVGMILDEAGTVNLVDVRIVPGRGSNGDDGAAGANGVDGRVGGSGAIGCEDGAGVCGTCARPLPGLGSFTFGVNGNGGDGGDPGFGDADGVNGDTGEGGARGGLRGFGGDFTGVTRDGDPGGAGPDGDGGFNGFAGFSDGDGEKGDNGVDGEGGGGGGGGAGSTADLFCDEFGGAGGGGGAGGTGGDGGGGGTRGGASIALAVSATAVTLVSSTLIGGAGGDGGDGGRGGEPGEGASGGAGGLAISSTDSDRGGNGGRGGDGGNGGRGGHGGGGGGGSSFALVVENGGDVTVDGSDLLGGSAGRGGGGPGDPGDPGRSVGREDR
ncbi:MAG: putative Ig domain-containing protein [Deltaproteobacteria bacterium]|nr:putative Ig domain-containing protein [Deltaproteobacteria bacterium]